MPWRLEDQPKHGDTYGVPHAGHRVTLLHAAVLIHPNGDEGLVSMATFDNDGNPTGRVTLVTSDADVLPMMKRMLAATQPPDGGRFEWRHYRLAIP